MSFFQPQMGASVFEKRIPWLFQTAANFSANKWRVLLCFLVEKIVGTLCHRLTIIKERRMFEKMRNLGPTSSRMLLAAGISSEAQLREMGAVRAYFSVLAAGARPSLNLLWALEGALTGRDWRDVSKTERTSLLLQLDDYDRSHRAAP